MQEKIQKVVKKKKKKGGGWVDGGLVKETRGGMNIFLNEKSSLHIIHIMTLSNT